MRGCVNFQRGQRTTDKGTRGVLRGPRGPKKIFLFYLFDPPPVWAALGPTEQTAIKVVFPKKTLLVTVRPSPQLPDRLRPQHHLNIYLLDMRKEETENFTRELYYNKHCI